MHHACVIHLSTVGVQPSYHFAELDIEAKLLQNLQNYMHVGLVSGVVKHRVQDSKTCISSLLMFVFVTRKCKSSSESELLLDFPPMVLLGRDEISIENGRIVVCKKFTRFNKITINDNYARLFAGCVMLLTAGLTAAVRCHHSILLASPRLDPLTQLPGCDSRDANTKLKNTEQHSG